MSTTTVFNFIPLWIFFACNRYTGEGMNELQFAEANSKVFDLISEYQSKEDISNEEDDY